MPEPVHILVVDDEQTIREVLTESLRQSGYLCDAAIDGVEALDKLRGNGFQVVVSDIDMPQMDGMQLVREIRTARPDTEVILLTGVMDVQTAVQSMRLGACDYLTKPFDLGELRITVERALEKQRLGRENREYRRALEERVTERTVELTRRNREVAELLHRLENSCQATLEALATALDTRDSETMGHSARVAAYTVEVARRMGVKEPELTDVYRGALLHDLGKIGVPDAILRKPGRLTAAEWREMRRHPEVGERILRGIKFLEGARQIVLSHQERYDGKGYPARLRGEAIPLGARIFAIVDTLDAMTFDRPYRAALSYEKARNEIVRFSGTQFDPKIVEVFLGIPAEEWARINRRVMDDVAARAATRP